MNGHYHLDRMIKAALRRRAEIGLCGTCMDARALHDEQLVEGARRFSLESDTFEGQGACFLEMGDGIAACATGDFYAEDAPYVTLRRPGRHWHLAKVTFEKYWLRRWFR